MSMPIPSRNGMPAQLEVVACDGRHVFVESTAAAMCDDAGVFTGLIMALRDMSEMRDEREERNLLHAAMNQTEEGILICEGMSRALYANPSFEMLMGVGKDEFMRRLDSPGRFGQDDIFALLLPVIQSGEPAAGLAHISVHDERRTLHYEITPVSDVVSQEPISLIVVWDVTKATRIEQELRQAQKMQAIGTLAGGIAHDFNNLLVPILMNAEMLSFSECRNEQDSGRLREIVSAATRARELVRQILTFTRGAAPTLTPMRMDKIVEEAASLCRGSLPADIHTEVSLRSERRVMANRTQLVQVFLNLCANAKEAMPNGGVMRVTVQDFDIEENGEPRRFVKVSFVDTGVGIESDKLERIFEPFFTTRPPGKGTGLGLSIVHGIIEAHGGRIQVESRPNRGTNIQLLFPVVDEAEETIVSHGEFENLRGRLSGEVLVVDDEPANASAIQSLLELMGLNVSTSPDGKTAQHLVTREPDRFRVVITDIGMSEMDGHELAQRLRAIRPDLPLVFISGRQDRLDSAMAAFENAASLMKPFDIDELAQTMHTFFPE
jgi:signal transduction histidine kinase/CheY-like chemotaxis protein